MDHLHELVFDSSCSTFFLSYAKYARSTLGQTDAVHALAEQTEPLTIVRWENVLSGDCSQDGEERWYGFMGSSSGRCKHMMAATRGDRAGRANRLRRLRRPRAMARASSLTPARCSSQRRWSRATAFSLSGFFLADASLANLSHVAYGHQDGHGQSQNLLLAAPLSSLWLTCAACCELRPGQ